MYVLRESILHELNNVCYWYGADRPACCQVRFEREADVPAIIGNKMRVELF